MKTLLKTITIALTLTSTALFASGSHSHSPNGHGHSHEKVTLTEAQIEAKAKEEIARLVDKKKIDKSWLKVAVTKMGKKTFGGKVEWAVVFDNKNIKDEKMKTLYIFLNLSGDIAGVNYTGN